MSTRVSAALHAAKQNWRRFAVVTAATVGIVGLSAGTGYTAATITSADIVDQTIQSRDIGNNAVGASELRGEGDDRGAAVRSEHIQDETVQWNDIAEGTIGPNRLQMDRLKPLFADGSASFEVVTGPTVTIDPNDTANISTPCSEGAFAVSGGYLATDQEVEVVDSAPNESGNAWILQVVNEGGDGLKQISPRVTCATVE